MGSLRWLTLGIVSAATYLGVATGQVPATTPPAAQQPAVAAAPEPRPVTAEVEQLRRDIEQLLRASSTRNSTHSVLVVSLDRGDTLFSHNADLPVAPASNMKLYSTAAALYYLGPNFRYSTFALAGGEIRDGTLAGDLVLYGTGDPAISSRMLSGALGPLRALADSLRAQGITRIEGDVVGDGSYFDDAWLGEGWKDEYRLDSYSAPIGALSLAENIVGIRVTPGASGQPAQIRTTPSTAGLLVQNRVRTVGSGGSSIRFAYDPEGLVIQGQIARGHPGVARTVTVVDPANFAASAFRTVLEAAGIEVTGQVRTIRTRAESPIGGASSVSDTEGRRPPRVLGTHLSPTLAEVASVTNHVSMNLFAEAMFKTVGRVAIGDGSFAAGARAVQYLLECEKPIDLTGIRIVDGSGLSPINRVTARSTIHLLDLMRRTDVWEAFYSSLPEAASPNGGAHSLRNRMGGTAAARNLRAKTGTIANVSALSGYVESANGEMLAFAIFANDVPSTWQSKQTEDRIGARLARFTRPDAPAALPGLPADSVTTDSTVALPAAPIAAATAPAPAAEAAAPAPQSSAPATATHRIARGETLDGIARRYDTSVADLQKLNPGIQPRRLQLGQTVKVPG